MAFTKELFKIINLRAEGSFSGIQDNAIQANGIKDFIMGMAYGSILKEITIEGNGSQVRLKAKACYRSKEVKIAKVANIKEFLLISDKQATENRFLKMETYSKESSKMTNLMVEALIAGLIDLNIWEIF